MKNLHLLINLSSNTEIKKKNTILWEEFTKISVCVCLCANAIV